MTLAVAQISPLTKLSSTIDQAVDQWADQYGALSMPRFERNLVGRESYNPIDAEWVARYVRVLKKDQPPVREPTDSRVSICCAEHLISLTPDGALKVPIFSVELAAGGLKGVGLVSAEHRAGLQACLARAIGTFPELSGQAELCAVIADSLRRTVGETGEGDPSGLFVMRGTYAQPLVDATRWYVCVVDQAGAQALQLVSQLKPGFVLNGSLAPMVSGATRWLLSRRPN